MSYQQNLQSSPEVIGRIRVNQMSENHSLPIQVNNRKRGNSANPTGTRVIPVPKKNTNDNHLSSIITQVQKDKVNQTTQKKASEQIKQKAEKSAKSHSYSPNRHVNSMQLGLLPPKTSNKKTLALDLDETLVHSGFMPFSSPSDVIIQIDIDNEIHDIHVLVRPGVKEFLEKMSERYELVIFTASVSKYADPLLDIIDKQGYCPFRLFREHCTLINTTFVKDLKRLGRDLKDIVIVDNSPLSYALNPDNGLPILTWFDDKNDRELYNITPILEFLSYVPDVRDYIKKIVVNNEISYSKAMNVINTYSTMLKKKNVHLVDNQENKDNTPEKKPQQINIKIINNNITNYICGANNKNEAPIEEKKERQRPENRVKISKNDSQVTKSMNLQSNSHKDDFAILAKNQKSVNTFRNITVSGGANSVNDMKVIHHRKGESFYVPGTNRHKNNFLNTGYVNTTKSNNIANTNQINVDFIKNTRKKNPIKYTSSVLTKKDTARNNNLSNSLSKNLKSSNFLHSTSTQEMISYKGKGRGISGPTGSKTSTNSGHVKSLSYNFDVSGLNTVRPKSSKKIIYSDSNDKKKKQLKDFRFELNEILQRRGVSKSSRANDLKGGFKYQSPVSMSNGYTVKYTNKIIK